VLLSLSLRSSKVLSSWLNFIPNHLDKFSNITYYQRRKQSKRVLKLRYASNEISSRRLTLREESVCGRKFCGFCVFCPNQKQNCFKLKSFSEDNYCFALLHRCSTYLNPPLLRCYGYDISKMSISKMKHCKEEELYRNYNWISLIPVGKINTIWHNMALYFECRINKNALLQTVFWRFCPLGLTDIHLLCI